MRIPRISGNEKGQSTVEFAFMLILCVVLIAGLASTAQIGYHWAVMQYAANEAARYGSLGQVNAGETREQTIRRRVLEAAHAMGVDDLTVEFLDQDSGATAGESSEFFRLRLSRPLDLNPVIMTLFRLNPQTDGALAPHYQLSVQTVVRNEPF